MAPHGLMFSQIVTKHFHEAFKTIRMAPGQQFQHQIVKKTPPLGKVTQSYENIGAHFLVLRRAHAKPCKIKKRQYVQLKSIKNPPHLENSLNPM